MFTGLVEAMGTVREARDEGPGRRLGVAAPEVVDGVRVGDSIAVSGVCLTAVAVDAQGFTFQLGPETLARTNLGSLAVGDRVNLERALALGDRLGGHVVQGHVDAVGRIARRETAGEYENVAFVCDREWTRFLAPKGSIAVDGVSLTLVDVSADGFSVMLIPHTLAVTTLGRKGPGDAVNLEVDVFAKQVVRYLDGIDWRAWLAK